MASQVQTKVSDRLLESLRLRGLTDFVARQRRLLISRRTAWRHMRNDPLGAICLRDLYHFIQPDAPAFFRGDDPNGRIHARNEGRREVWLHIQRRLRMSDTELENMLKEVSL